MLHSILNDEDGGLCAGAAAGGDAAAAAAVQLKLQSTLNPRGGSLTLGGSLVKKSVFAAPHYRPQ